MHVSKPREKTDIEKILRRVAESIPAAAWSSSSPTCSSTASRCFRAWRCSRQRRHDILVFHVLDDDELTFPFAGTTRFEGMEELPHLLCDPRACATATWRRWKSTWSRCAAAARRLGIDYQLVRTSDYLDAVLSKFLHHRMAMRSGGSRR